MSEPAGGSRGGVPQARSQGGPQAGQALPQGLGKLYFRIGEVAELVGVEPHVLRYWEREFRSVRPTKSAKGQRVYSRRDVESLMRVRELLYKEGFTIAGAKKKLQQSGAEPELTQGGHGTQGLHEKMALPGAAEVETDARGQANQANQANQAKGETRKQLLAMRKDIEEFLLELRPRQDGPSR
jgi:DNA-binding transcriptional MerR regulator